MAREFLLTLLTQITIKAQDDDAYIIKRDKLIEKLEKMGFDVNVENEDDDGSDFVEEGGTEEGYYDE